MPALKEMQQCFQPYTRDVYSYSSTSTAHKADCSSASLNLWQAIKKINNHPNNEYESMLIKQNTRVVLDGEKYLRIVTNDRVAGWNIREQHMFETVKDLIHFNNSQLKIIIWAHNTHVGDAHYTDMGSRGKTNLGELIRATYGKENVFIIGFGSYKGTVAGVEKWGSAFNELNMPPAYKGSWEEILHHSGNEDKIILSKDILNTALNRWIDQRAIGIVYHPKTELSYIPSIIPSRYDAFIYIDHSTALHQALLLSNASSIKSIDESLMTDE
jgi:erythromycin esterase-like protein